MTVVGIKKIIYWISKNVSNGEKDFSRLRISSFVCVVTLSSILVILAVGLLRKVQ